MLFNSIDFTLFLPIVFILYWFVFDKSIKIQNAFLLLASYVFYGWWDWRFLSLIVFSSVLDYFIGLKLHNALDIRKRKILLGTSIFINLGFLGFFKYYNFFLENFITAFSFMGQEIRPGLLTILLPVGISFYTFQTLSYSIDIYRKKLEPSKDFLAFGAFVSFFPQLVAGPIERASNLLPQFYQKRRFDYYNAVNGLRQILWGLFKKMVIADNSAIYANMIFNNHEQYDGSTLVLGAVFFAFQIYGDFSGYSDIAIGTSRLFGFNLMRNFAYPYFSRDIAEFWRRWHISLSTWFRDYLYIPLGGSKGGLMVKIRNTFIIFLVSGFWHGASWTFIVWGALNALFFLPLLLFNKNRNNMGVVAQGKLLPSLRESVNMVLTFGLTTFAWIFFRAENMGHAMSYISGIFSPSLFYRPELAPGMEIIFILLFFFMIIEWMGREGDYAIENLGLQKPVYLRWSFYSLVIFLIGIYMPTQESPFIYFQF